MDIHFTARKFKAHTEVKNYAIESVKKLDRLYDRIVRCDIILSYERATNSIKSAEIVLHVHGPNLYARESSDSYNKSIDLAVDKLEQQLAKYKAKLKLKDKHMLRRVKQQVVSITSEEEE